MRTAVACTYETFNTALLDVLLPVLPASRRGEPVLISCDDETVAAAAALLGCSTPDPSRLFGRLVEGRFHIGWDGSADGVRRCAAVHRARSRDEVPPFFGACCAFVLAASRMTTDSGAHAVNYYDRLWEVLGRRPSKPGQYDLSYLPCLLGYVADWLREDQQGTRGHLLVQGGGPPHVGYAINQCVFRERDREHLAEFFATRVGRHRDGVDLLRLLQVSSDRHHLTYRARLALSSLELQEPVRAALTHLFETWDGSRPDARGGRAWLASLHLSVNRKLRLTVSAPDAPSGLALDCERILADPERDRVALRPAELTELAAHGLRWGSAGVNGIYLPRSGDTLVFEVREDLGLVWATAPTANHVFLLTCDQHTRRQLSAYAARVRGAEALPDGWALFERVPADQLPQDPARAVGARPPVALTGGLRVGARRYLIGHGPRVEVGDVEEPLRVRVGGEDAGTLAAGEDLTLTLAAGEHHVDVGDGLVRWTVHMLDQVPAREPYGALARPLGDRGARAGATNRARLDGDILCGALLSDPYTGELPLMLRASQVLLIGEDGSSQTVLRPDAPEWLAHIGLPAGGVRWEAEVTPEIVWALTGEQAIAIRPVALGRLDAAARAAVDRLASRTSPRVRSLHRCDRDAALEAFLEMATQPEPMPA